MVNEIKNGEGVEPGEEKVWSMVQVLKESRKGFSPTSGKVRTYMLVDTPLQRSWWTHPTTAVLFDALMLFDPCRIR